MVWHLAQSSPNATRRNGGTGKDHRQAAAAFPQQRLGEVLDSDSLELGSALLAPSLDQTDREKPASGHNDVLRTYFVSKRDDVDDNLDVQPLLCCRAA